MSSAPFSPPPRSLAPGPLPDLPISTLVRFVRAYRHGAGLEYDVDILNESLLQHYPLHIIHIHMTLPGTSTAWTEEKLGRGRMTYVPIERDVLPVGSDASLSPGRSRGRKWIRDRMVFSPLLRPLVRQWAVRHRPSLRPGDVVGVGGVLREVCDQMRPELLMVHAGGGRDAWDALALARSRRIPRGMLLHYANAKYLDGSVRLQTFLADGCAGVSDVKVPDYLRDRFAPLFTAVDTDRFSPGTVMPSAGAEIPWLFLPARIVPSKGHNDLLDAAIELHRRGVKFRVAIAGRADQPDYEADLRRRIAAADLTKSFQFLGMLDEAGMIDWYRRSSLLAFPTYHHEGCPRIILEAAACGLPAVTYDTGGTRSALRPGSTGRILPTGDVAGFTQALQDLLGDAEEISRLGRAARQLMLAEFNRAALVRRHVAFYRRIMGLDRSRRD